MECLDATFGSPEENLAADEVLLDRLDSGRSDAGGVLRFWESSVPFVVLGHANRWSDEVEAAACEELSIPILRRCSGGGAVMQGAGCLNYAVVLPYDDTGPLGTVTGTNCFVMERHRAVFEGLLGREVRIAGHTDLVFDGLKFSGNAQRRRKRALLFHGTFLLEMDLPLMSRVLRHPSIQPKYREGRPHGDFVGNLSLPRERVKAALKESWQAQSSCLAHEIPCFIETLQDMALTRYRSVAWNRKF